MASDIFERELSLRADEVITYNVLDDLAKKLDPTTKNVICKNWKNVADSLQFNYEDIDYLEWKGEQRSPTHIMFSKWIESKGENATLRIFLSVLQRLEILTCVEIVQNAIVEYKRKQNPDAKEPIEDADDSKGVVSHLPIRKEPEEHTEFDDLDDENDNKEEEETEGINKEKNDVQERNSVAGQNQEETAESRKSNVQQSNVQQIMPGHMQQFLPFPGNIPWQYWPFFPSQMYQGHPGMHVDPTMISPNIYHTPYTFRPSGVNHTGFSMQPAFSLQGSSTSSDNKAGQREEEETSSSYSSSSDQDNEAEHTDDEESDSKDETDQQEDISEEEETRSAVIVDNLETINRYPSTSSHESEEQDSKIHEGIQKNFTHVATCDGKIKKRKSFRTRFKKLIGRETKPERPLSTSSCEESGYESQPKKGKTYVYILCTDQMKTRALDLKKWLIKKKFKCSTCFCDDQYVDRLRENLKRIKSADFVCLLCNEQLKSIFEDCPDGKSPKNESQTVGSTYLASNLVYEDLMAHLGNHDGKYIPITLEELMPYRNAVIPSALTTLYSYCWPKEKKKLLCHLRREPEMKPTPVNPNPIPIKPKSPKKVR